jgi:aldehyde dehydrogenase (NAD+)
LWCFGDSTTCSTAKALSAGNLKQTWTNEGRALDLFSVEQGEGRAFLQHAYQLKNIWVPYGE